MAHDARVALPGARPAGARHRRGCHAAPARAPRAIARAAWKRCPRVGARPRSTRGKLFCLREAFRAGIELERQDLLAELPQRAFDLVLCRNMAFTYFSDERARLALERLASRLRFGGAFVLGLHERLPASSAAFEPWPGCRAVFRLRAPV
ncbi:MAG TPA: CheR family methyltransferase [Burkholderiales bacterium]|jgi:chemotaxis protein methyltransferase CheR|nr:CheR family methyltransferase [Burkholderiales bacterium]